MAAAGAVAALWLAAAWATVGPEGCSGELSGERPRLTSPRYLVRQHSLRVAVASLHLGGRRFCGRVRGQRAFPLDARGLVVRFRSQPNSRGRGFDLTLQHITCADDGTTGRNYLCDGVFSSPGVLLASPREPRNHPNKSESCLYVVRPESPRFCQLEVTFRRFSLDNSTRCAKPRLEIAGQDVLCREVAGSRRYQWKDNELQILFVTDGENVGHGFQIYVTQIPCHEDDSTLKISKSSSSNEQNSTDYELNRISSLQSTATALLSDLQNPRLCFGKIYSDKVFIITSPEIPNDTRRNGECVIVIQQHNSDVCRLRLMLKYFCVGEEHNHTRCDGGYLEVDGRQICGCQNGRAVTSEFGLAGNEGQKILKYVPGKLHIPAVRGFVIEVVQETCFVIENRNEINLDHHAAAWPKTLSQLVRHRPPVISDSSQQNSEDSESTNEHSQGSRREESSEGIRVRRSPYENSFWKCNLKTWFRQLGEVFGKTCPSPQAPRCRVTNEVEGSLQSPNYPGPYPANLRCCYRIARRAGHCRVQLTMLDFSLQLSPGCGEDYLVLGDSGRYCGASLAATTSYLDLSARGHADVLFATDSGGAGRGFRAAFRQLPCSAWGPTTPGAATARPPSYPCGDLVRGRSFRLASARYNLALAACTFTVLRAGQDVCGLQISMERFNLTCGQESLQIGSQFYCGVLTGNYVSAKFSGDEVQIVYRKSTVDSPGEFVIQGQQVADCELKLEVPLARIQGARCAVRLGPPAGERSSLQRGDPADCSYVFARSPGSCGLQLDVDRFRTRSTDGCTDEFVELDGRRFCGSQLRNLSKEILFNGSDITVPYLIEDGTKTSKWHFSYKYIAC